MENQNLSVAGIVAISGYFPAAKSLMRCSSLSTTLLPIDSVLPIISNMQVDIFVDNQPLDLQCFCEVLQINYGN